MYEFRNSDFRLDLGVFTRPYVELQALDPKINQALKAQTLQPEALNTTA